ncbi:hypothetical protein BGZ76_009981 [Entomortierella beljakovae]|nr:hypothetical protein BGZ76_009981 [Entomortierella beljakovae]
MQENNLENNTQREDITSFREFVESSSFYISGDNATLSHTDSRQSASVLAEGTILSTDINIESGPTAVYTPTQYNETTRFNSMIPVAKFKRSRRHISLVEKIAIINSYQSDSKSVSQLSKDFEIKRSTIHGIIKAKNEILKRYNASKRP